VKSKTENEYLELEEQKTKQQYLKMIIFYLKNLKGGLPMELGKEIITEIA